MITLAEISKQFDKVQALNKVSLKITPGSIHGIIGENGAGKSTLMKILTGFISKSDGEIYVNSQKITIHSPRDARSIGIGMLYQEPLDFPQLSVLDNFMAGGVGFSPANQKKTLTKLCNTFGFTLDPESQLEELTVGERQQLELIRLIRDGARILILDEPTSGISNNQQELLFSALLNLKNKGVAILLVSHKLEEIDILCDEVTVLRHGEVVDYQIRPFNRNSMLHAMFDTMVESKPITVRNTTGNPILDFHQVTSTVGRSGLNAVSNIIRCGEVVGLAGVDGSGQSVFLKSAFGLLQPESGQISYSDKDISSAFLPADRLAEALIPGLTIREHHILSTKVGQFITSKSSLEKTRQAIKTFSIKGTPETAIENLSGGNLQRLLLSLIPLDTKLILMENPTRGLDVQSAAWTWKHLHDHLKPDGAIVFASPDLEELLEQSSRILVFYDGSIALDTPTEATSSSQISQAITGQDCL